MKDYIIGSTSRTIIYADIPKLDTVGIVEQSPANSEYLAENNLWFDSLDSPNFWIGQFTTTEGHHIIYGPDKKPNTKCTIINLVHKNDADLPKTPLPKNSITGKMSIKEIDPKELYKNIAQNREQKIKQSKLDLELAIKNLGFTSQKEFCKFFGYSPNELSRQLNNDKPLPARLRNIVEAHERTKEIILNCRD